MSTVRDFGARGDGRTDDTQALQHAIGRVDGQLTFTRGEYVITRPLQIPLQMHGRMHISGEGGTARIRMNAAGPALHLVGTHRGTAAPNSVEDRVWQQQRMPTVRDLEIVGGNAMSDGIRIDGVMQPTIQGVLIRNCRHGIHLTNRNRNVIINNCQIYDNSGIGVFLDRVNLHQIIINANHISYCKMGGIKVSDSEIRNFQICSNDIEYNHDTEAQTSADVLLDCRNGTVREGTIVGNTIQAVGTPNGANVRFLGVGANNPNAVGLWAITGNLIGSQTTAIDLQASRGVTVTGNSIYSGYHHALRIENSDHIVIGSNTIDHNPEYRGNSTDQILLRNSRNISLNGLVIQHTFEPEVAVDSSVEVRNCENVHITGCQLINARQRGLHLIGSRTVMIQANTIRGRAGDDAYRLAILADAQCRRVMAVNNFLDPGRMGAVQLPEGTGQASGNVELD